MKVKFTFIILIFIFSSCILQKKLKEKGTIIDARSNIIKDFYSHSFFKKGKVFSVDTFKENKKSYVFQIYKENKYLLELEDSIGKYPKYPNYFPTRYKEVNNKLFLWVNPKYKITIELINIMNKYNAIDSSYYKNKNFIPVISTGDIQKSLYYFVCKKTISNFKKVKAIWVDPKSYSNYNKSCKVEN